MKGEFNSMTRVLDDDVEFIREVAAGEISGVDGMDVPERVQGFAISLRTLET